MDTIRRISRNLFFQGISELIVKGLQVVILIYIARFLKETEFGKFNFAIAFTAISLIFIDLGLQPLLVREISRKNNIAGKYISHTIIIKSVLSIIGFLIVIIIMNLMKYAPDVRLTVYLMFISTIFKSLTDALSSVFLALERMHWDTFIKALRAGLLVSLVFFGLLKNFHLIYVASMYAITEFIVLLLCIAILFTRFIKFTVKIQKGLIKYLTLESLPFALTVLFYSIYFYIDSVMLSKMRGLYEVGIYSAAYNLTIALVSIPYIYVYSIFPSLSRFYVNSRGSIEFAYKKSLLYISLIALPITAILFFAGDNIIHFLYGPGYHKSVLVLKIVAITIFFRFITFVNGIVIISIDKQKQRLYYQGATAIINIVLNFVLIPYYGYLGAAIATVATELFLFITYFSPVAEYLKTWHYISLLIKPAIAGLIASLLFFISINTFIKIALFLILYFVLLLMLKVFKSEDWDIFKRILTAFKNKET